LEEVQPGEEVQEISDNILDQNASGLEEFENGAAVQGDLSADTTPSYENGLEPFSAEVPSLNGAEERVAEGETDDDGTHERSDAFEEIDYGREFQDYLDPGYRTQEIEY
jgi:hypothetical protein